MKIFIPRNISGGWFNMSVTIWPASISVVQLLIVALWIGLSLGVWNNLTTNGVERIVAFFMVLPILLIFVFIAFFKYSELSLIPFLAKMVKTYFLDTTSKFQVTWNKPDPVAIAYAHIKKVDQDVTVAKKNLELDDERLGKLHLLSQHDDQESV